MGRWARRLSAAAIGTIAALVFAGTAFAHVEVEADPDTAGSSDAVVTFSAEAESSSAGIKSVQIVLPTTIQPQDITLNKAPAGWKLTKNADGYTVAGAALPTGEEAVHSIVVMRLPDTPEVVFKALVTYSDNSVDRWIEAPTTANPNPDNAAPVLKLKPGAAPTQTAGPSVTTELTPAPTSSGAIPIDYMNGDSGSNAWIWWVVAAVVVIGAIAVILARRRR